jgi:DNA-directed RNA polymerase specialized sigma24 family protein
MRVAERRDPGEHPPGPDGAQGVEEGEPHGVYTGPEGARMDIEPVTECASTARAPKALLESLAALVQRIGAGPGPGTPSLVDRRDAAQELLLRVLARAGPAPEWTQDEHRVQRRLRSLARDLRRADRSRRGREFEAARLRRGRLVDDPLSIAARVESRNRAVARLCQALAALPPPYRQILALRDYQGATHAEIGAYLTRWRPISVHRARELEDRALEMVRVWLGGGDLRERYPRSMDPRNPWWKSPPLSRHVQGQKHDGLRLPYATAGGRSAGERQERTFRRLFHDAGHR